MTSRPRGQASVDRIGSARPQRRWAVFGAVLALMLVAATLVAFSPAMVVLHEFALIDHLGELCLLWASKLVSPVHRIFEVAIGIGLIVAIVDRYRAWRDSRMLLRSVDHIPPAPGSILMKACEEAGINPARLIQITDCPIPAFTIGGIKPLVVLNHRMPELLSRDELVAVLAHEAEHVRRRDPLRLSAMRFLSRTLFFLPAIRALEAHMAEEAELRADKAAARKSGMATAAALLTLIRNFGRVGMPALATGMSQHEFVALRVRLLAGHDAATISRVSNTSLLTTVGALLLLWGAAIAELHQSTHTEHIVPTMHECVGEPGSDGESCSSSGDVSSLASVERQG